MPRLADRSTIGALRLRNRLVLPPITTKCGRPDGTITERILRFYEERSGDVGLVIVEATAVLPDGRIRPESLGLWDEAQVPGMARLAETIRKRGAAPVVQLNHAGARATPTGGGVQGASPSAVAFRGGTPPTSMDPARIERVTRAFADAAGRAASAGFDGVEIHGAHFYLISQFLSPVTNLREDRHGGDARARATFAVEVVQAVRRRVGASCTILFRLNATENVEGGQTLEDAVTVGRLLVESGVDLLDVSAAPQVSWLEENGKRLLSASSALPKDASPGAIVPLAARIRKETGVPVIAVGKLGEGTAAEEAVARGGVDLVAIGRQMIADPDTAGKILAGKGDEIVRCRQCMGCFGSLADPNPVTCAVNENMGRWQESKQ